MNKNSEGISELEAIDKLLGFRALVDELGKTITDLKEIIPALDNTPELDLSIKRLDRINTGFTQILEDRPVNNGPVFPSESKESA